MASRGRAQPAEFEPRAPGTRGTVPASGSELPPGTRSGDPHADCSQMPLAASSSEVSGRKPRPQPTAPSPVCRPPWLDAVERRQSTEQLCFQTPAGSEAPSGPGGLFGERRKSA